MKPRTLKSKIILYVLLITIIPTLFFAVFYYSSTKDIYEKNMLDTAEDNIYYMKKSLDERVMMANGLSDWFFVNNNFDKVLTREYDTNSREYRQDILTVYKQIELRLINSPFFTYISSVVVIGDNGVVFRYGTDASMLDIEEIKAEEWFQKGLEKNGMAYWGGIVKNPAKIKMTDNILPVVRPVLHSALDKRIGWVFIGFKESLLSDIYISKRRDPIYRYFLLDNQGRGIPHDYSESLIKGLNIEKEIMEILPDYSGYFPLAREGDEMMLVYEKIDYLNWTLVEIISLEGLNEQQSILRKMSFFIFIFSLIFTAIFTIYLSFNLTKPIKRLKGHMNRISDGIFERNPSIEGEDEMGKLGIKINEMAANIKNLLNRLVKEEQAKRKLELRALQNQVNPHFLYNTLNSIKWMAVMQKAEGIKNMVIVLGRLLKSLTSNTDEKISLEQELALLKDFIYIQQIRHSGKIDLKVSLENEELMECKIIKFILQPIVENSIFHGIDPKMNSGRIELKVKKAKNDLLIIIRDDGIGMSSDKIRSIIQKPGDDNIKHQGLSGIGIKNVDNRIKLIYGKKYGISIESSEGEFTEVAIHIPCEMGDKPDSKGGIE
ncbi:MAG TPA: sensor histidine kinase [Halanaerobiales bacterium]|nr:sensor histidine kinase [Halanaerobiales bacterium]